MTELNLLLEELLLVVGVLSALFGFHRMYIRPAVASAVKQEARLAALELWRTEQHSTAEKMMTCLHGVREDIHEIKTHIAVLEERSKTWGEPRTEA